MVRQFVYLSLNKSTRFECVGQPSFCQMAPPTYSNCYLGNAASCTHFPRSSILMSGVCFYLNFPASKFSFQHFFIFPAFHQGNAESATPDPESFDSSAVFLDDLQFSSISQGGDTLEFEGEFMEGLEFPDIDQNSDSESEHIDHEPISNLQVDNKPKQVAIKEAQSKKSNDGVSKQTSGSSKSVMTSSGNTDVSDYEMLDQSEAEGMTPTDETDNVDSSGRLGSVTNYVGKWLGY